MVATTVRATVYTVTRVWKQATTMYLSGRPEWPSLDMSLVPRKITAMILNTDLKVRSWTDPPPRLAYLNVRSGVIDDPKELPLSLRVLTIGSIGCPTRMESLIYLPEGIRNLTLYLTPEGNCDLRGIPRSVRSLSLWNYNGSLGDIPDYVTTLRLFESRRQTIGDELPRDLSSLTIFGHEHLEVIEALPIGLYDLSITFCPELASCGFPAMLNSLKLSHVSLDLELPQLLVLESLSLGQLLATNGYEIGPSEDAIPEYHEIWSLS